MTLRTNQASKTHIQALAEKHEGSRCDRLGLEGPGTGVVGEAPGFFQEVVPIFQPGYAPRERNKQSVPIYECIGAGEPEEVFQIA
jgi:hypothetical protein